MTDFELLAMLVNKSRGEIGDWITRQDEEEIEVFFGEPWGDGFYFTFNAKTGMIKGGEW